MDSVKGKLENFLGGTGGSSNMYSLINILALNTGSSKPANRKMSDNPEWGKKKKSLSTPPPVHDWQQDHQENYQAADDKW